MGGDAAVAKGVGDPAGPVLIHDGQVTGRGRAGEPPGHAARAAVPGGRTAGRPDEIIPLWRTKKALPELGTDGPQGHPGRGRRLGDVAAGRVLCGRAGAAAGGPPGRRVRGTASRHVRRHGQCGRGRDRGRGAGAGRGRGRTAAAGRRRGRPGRRPAHVHHRAWATRITNCAGWRTRSARTPWSSARRPRPGTGWSGRWPSGWSRPGGGRSPSFREQPRRGSRHGSRGRHRGRLRAGPEHRPGPARRGLAGRAGRAARRCAGGQTAQPAGRRRPADSALAVPADVTSPPSVAPCSTACGTLGAT